MGNRSLRAIGLASASAAALATAPGAMAQTTDQAPPRGAREQVADTPGRIQELAALSAGETAPAQQGSQPPAARATNTDATSVGELIVTARKREENIQKVPLSITAVTGAQLKVKSISTVMDLQQLVPSLIVEPAYDDPNSVVVTMRGRKQDDATLTTDASISYTVDGLYVPRTLGMQGEFTDLDRVEVLRGPQGTLFGRNATGGAIAIYTNDPTDQYGGSLDVTGGNYGTWNVIGIVNIPIVGDVLDARFVAQAGGNGGYAHNSTGGSLFSDKSQNYRAKIRWNITNHWTADFETHYEASTAGGFEGNISGLTPANFQNNGLPEGGLLALEEQAETGLPLDQAVALLQSYVGGYKYSLIDNTLNLPPAYNLDSPSTHIERWDEGLNITGDLSSDLKFHSITGVQHLLRSNLTSTQVAVQPFVSTYDTSDLYLSQEFQLLGDMHNLNWVVGLYGGIERGKDNTTVTVLPALLGPNIQVLNTGVKNSTLAAYGQATWEFLPNWHLTVGGRFTRDTRAIISDDFIAPTFNAAMAMVQAFCVVPAPGVESSNTAAQCPREFANTFTKPTWLVSVDYQITPSVLAYVKAATGYRSGGQNEGGAVELETFATVQPEENLEYEAGVKAQFFDNRVRLNLDGYNDDYTNLQVTSRLIFADGNLGTIITNAAKATIQGFEAEGDADVFKGLTIHGSVAFTDARYTNFVDITGDRTHQPFAVPKWTFDLSGQFVQPTKLGDLLFILDYSWKSATDLDGASALTLQETQPAYGLLNGRINLHLDNYKLDIAVFGKNITNVDYWAQGLGLESLGFNQTLKGAPATYGIELIKRFGA